MQRYVGCKSLPLHHASLGHGIYLIAVRQCKLSNWCGSIFWDHSPDWHMKIIKVKNKDIDSRAMGIMIALNFLREMENIYHQRFWRGKKGEKGNGDNFIKEMNCGELWDLLCKIWLQEKKSDRDKVMNYLRKVRSSL